MPDNRVCEGVGWVGWVWGCVCEGVWGYVRVCVWGVTVFLLFHVSKQMWQMYKNTKLIISLLLI